MNISKVWSWLAALLALAGQVFVIFKSPLAFVFWTMGEGLLLYIALRRREWGEVTFFTLYVVTNIIALYVWIKY